jgi:hypothetical protein
MKIARFVSLQFCHTVIRIPDPRNEGREGGTGKGRESGWGKGHADSESCVSLERISPRFPRRFPRRFLGLPRRNIGLTAPAIGPKTAALKSLKSPSSPGSARTGAKWAHSFPMKNLQSHDFD